MSEGGKREIWGSEEVKELDTMRVAELQRIRNELRVALKSVASYEVITASIQEGEIFFRELEPRTWSRVHVALMEIVRAANISLLSQHIGELEVILNPSEHSCCVRFKK